jgi:hypothetical protein
VKKTDISDDLEKLIDVIDGISEYQLKSYAAKVETPIEEINKKIEIVNEYIVEYIDLLKTSQYITKNNNARWNELIADFNLIYPFEAYSADEPLRYQEKINLAKDINSSVFDIVYDLEEMVTKTIKDNTYEYSLKGEIILPSTGIVNDLTFTATYRYFSKFY